MTQKQARARAKAIEAVHRIGEVFKANDMDCSELLGLLANERAALGIGRLMIQASWQTWKADQICDIKFRDVAFHFLYQCYLKQKPKRKTKAKK